MCPSAKVPVDSRERIWRKLGGDDQAMENIKKKKKQRSDVSSRPSFARSHPKKTILPAARKMSTSAPVRIASRERVSRKHAGNDQLLENFIARNRRLPYRRGRAHTCPENAPHAQVPIESRERIERKFGGGRVYAFLAQGKAIGQMPGKCLGPPESQ